jgi:mono/diheme cytochrome c family protein
MRTSPQGARQSGLTAILAAILLMPLMGSAQIPKAKDSIVLPVSGESWLHHLSRNFNDTSMGKTGRLGPPVFLEEDPRWQTGLSQISAQQSVALHGSDLYRLNCQGCHGESGLGAPPEINSLINPVRATSARLLLERMKKAGMEITPASAAEMAHQSSAALQQRLHNGGQDMPPFAYLDEAETRLLIGYLNQLADVPGAERQQTVVRETRVRVGEHIVLSTCHICHDATGANPAPQQLMDGAIPPLSTLAARVNLAQFVRKVTHGAPVTMGVPPEPLRGRMPVFGYLSDDEAADAYLYLTIYAPQPWTAAAFVSAAPASPTNSGSGNRTHVSVADDPDNPQPISVARLAVFPGVLFVFLGAVLVTGLPLLAKPGLRGRHNLKFSLARRSWHKGTQGVESNREQNVRSAG